jgi:hypothetical protein
MPVDKAGRAEASRLRGIQPCAKCSTRSCGFSSPSAMAGETTITKSARPAGPFSSLGSRRSMTCTIRSRACALFSIDLNRWRSKFHSRSKEPPAAAASCFIWYASSLARTARDRKRIPRSGGGRNSKAGWSGAAAVIRILFSFGESGSRKKTCAPCSIKVDA